MEPEMQLLSERPRNITNSSDLAWLALRYVDNLLAVFVTRGPKVGMPLELLDKHFYGKPIVLGDEPDLTYVGLQIHRIGCNVEASWNVQGFDKLAASYYHCYDDGPGDDNNNSVTDLFIAERWRYRSYRSGGSSTSLLSGMSSRLHSAARMSFPLRRAQISVLKLWAVSLHLGHPRSELRRLMMRHARKYPSVYSNLVTAPLLQAFREAAPKSAAIIVGRITGVGQL
jgi:hypothetical protein